MINSEMLQTAQEILKLVEALMSLAQNLATNSNTQVTANAQSPNSTPSLPANVRHPVSYQAGTYRLGGPSRLQNFFNRGPSHTNHALRELEEDRRSRNPSYGKS